MSGPAGVVVQHVTTWWTVASRGAPASSMRNAAPVAFPLPPKLLSGLHEVIMREAEGFRPVTRQEDALEPGRLRLRLVDGTLRVRPPEAGPLGLEFPQRKRRPPGVRLAEGEWVRWQINYKMLGLFGGPSQFRLDTYNVLYGAPASPEVFLGEPTRFVDERGYLR